MPIFNWLTDLFRGGNQAARNKSVEAGSAGEYFEFLTLGKWMAVTSSNVALAQYDHESEKLYIEYKNGATYSYHPVSYREALSFAQADSKGKWVWSVLRIRGTKLGHRKAYEMTSAGFAPDTEGVSHYPPGAE